MPNDNNNTTKLKEMADLIWSIADLLRGDYKKHEYADVILPLTVFKRLDQVAEPAREKVYQAYTEYRDKLDILDRVLRNAADNIPFYNTSPFNWPKLLAAPGDIEHNFVNFLNGFSPEVGEIIDKFDFRKQIPRLKNANLLYKVLKRFENVDLSPETIDNHSMGTVFEELIRRFSEEYNETAGEHFTPREVIDLMVRLIFANGSTFLTSPNRIISIYDPACGTGGMLTEASNFIAEHNPNANINLFGQELNPSTFAVAQSDMLIKGDKFEIAFGNSFSEDHFAGKHFDIMLSNPPYGVEWKKVEEVIRLEYETKGFDGRFGAGLPRITDGSLLFLQHMISKMKETGESRIAIILNGSPLFTGDAGSGESSIRRWVIENDLLEAIVALPEQLFYNTGIATYVWVLSNHKSEHRKGKVQLIHAVDFYGTMKKSLGNKRRQIPPHHQVQVIQLYQDFKASEYSLIFDNTDFAYRRIKVERPLKLNFQASPERIERIKEQAAFLALNPPPKKQKVQEEDTDAVQFDPLNPLNEKQEQLLHFMSSLSQELVKNQPQFEKLLDGHAKQHKFILEPRMRKAILSALSERDETADTVLGKSGSSEPDPELRDFENVPYKQDVFEFFEKEVLPHVPDAWIDQTYIDTQDGKVGIVGYEINFNRYFYKYNPPRPLEEIDQEIKQLEQEIIDLLREVTD